MMAKLTSLKHALSILRAGSKWHKYFVVPWVSHC